MSNETTASSHARRNRIIAIPAGAITVIAIVLAFASEHLELPWKWIRPTAELLLLGELVGLIVLERHRLFEPVRERVEELKDDNEELKAGNADLRAMLARMDQKLDAGGQLPVTVGIRESLRLNVRLVQQALDRPQDGPQIMRISSLSGSGGVALWEREIREEFVALRRAYSELVLTADSAPDAKGHRWLQRGIQAFTTPDAFKLGMDFLRSTFADIGALNMEFKVMVRSRPEALLSPRTITDNDVFLSYDDGSAQMHWALVIEGRQYVTLFARWFDDLWTAIPDSYLVYSRNGINQRAVERIQKELEVIEAARNSAHVTGDHS